MGVPYGKVESIRNETLLHITYDRQLNYTTPVTLLHKRNE